MIATWLDTVTLNSGVNTIWAGFTTYGDQIHLVYWETGDLCRYKKSTDEGTSWTSPVTIGTADEVPLTQCIAVDGNYVHVVYVRTPNSAGNPPTLHYRRSVDGGANWDGEVTLDDGTGVANNRFIRVSLMAEGGYVHCFWASQDSSTFVPSVLSYRRSTDNGTIWAAETTLASATGAGRPEAHLIDATIHLVWTDTRDGSSGNGGETYYMKSTDRGVNWGTPVNLSNTAEHNTIRPSITGSGSNVVAAWQYPAGTPGSEDIISRYSTNGGDSWSGAATIVTGTGSQEHATLDTQGGITALVYSNLNDTPTTTHVQYSMDYGVSWGSAQTPYTPGANAEAPLVQFTSRFVQVMDRQGVSGGLKLNRSPVFSTEPASDLLDDFNRATLDANWTQGVTTFTDGLTITGSTAVCQLNAAGAYRQGGYYNAATFSDLDVIAEVSAWVDTNANGFAVYARLRQIAAGTTDGYSLDITRGPASTEWNLFRTDNTATTIIDTPITRDIATNAKVAITCRGNLIIAWHFPSGASEWTQVLAGVDSTYVGPGNVGLEFFNDQVTKVTNLWASENTEPIVDTVATARILRTSRGTSW